MKLLRVGVIGICIFASSCAILVKDDRQMVRFKGAPEEGLTKVITPDGTFDIENGQASYLLTRSRSDVPLTILCPDGSREQSVASTKFDMLAGGVGAFLMWPVIGNIIDATSNKAYDYPEISLYGKCNSKQKVPVRDVANQKD